MWHDVPERPAGPLSLVASQLIVVLQVYLLPQYPAPPANHGKSRVKDFRFVTIV